MERIKKFTEQLRKLAPPGIRLESECGTWLTGLLLALLYSMRFMIAFGNERSDMYYYDPDTKIRHIVSGFVMPDYADLAEGSLNGFFLVALCVLFAAAYHYTYYSSQGSRALYLVRRLPDRFYLLKTCVTLPVLASAATLLFALLLYFVNFGLYHLLTPEECLRAGQWARLWSF
ncbi:MAG: hypothetical protein IJC71_05740 [Clostridia bacterium]|nr:hypothetical protein [Clostridia bacterium]